MFVQQYADVPCYSDMFAVYTIGIHAAMKPLW